MIRVALAAVLVTGVLLHASVAAAEPGHVAVLGPDRSPIVARVARNFSAETNSASVHVVSSCTRATVAAVLVEAQAETAICTDGDVVTVWQGGADFLHLVDAVPVTSDDDRSIELLAARVTMAARDGHSPTVQTSMTIVANPSSASLPTEREIDPAADRPATIAPRLPPTSRVAPQAVFSAGPTLFGSSDGSSLGFTLQADIGVSRVLALTPWIGVIPVPRKVTTPAAGVGTAEYRPTLFGLGVNIPLLGPGSILVPRLGAGYAILWVHSWPDSVGPAGISNGGEDLFAPVMYATAAASLRVYGPFRVAVEGMVGEATSEAEIRLAGVSSADWGQPLASLALRGEVVLP